MISYPCVDSLFAFADSLYEFLLLVLSLISLSYFIILIQIIMRIYKRTTPALLIKLLKVSLELTCNFYFIPSSIILVLLFKYSYVNYSKIQEYATNSDVNSLNLGIAGMILSIFFLFLHLALALIYESCNFEIRHSMADKYLQAKSSPIPDLIAKIIYFINCICFATIQLSNYKLYLAIAVFTYSYCTYKYLYFLPYYSTFVNFIKVLLHFQILLISIFFLISSFINNATIVFVLSIVLQPFIILFVRDSTRYRISKINKISEEIKSSLNIFELSAREQFTSSNEYEKFLKDTNQNYSYAKDKLIFVFQAIYCEDILFNLPLASVKISVGNYKGINIVTNFQVFKCQARLNKKLLEKSLSLQLHEYLLDFDKIIKADKKLCYILLNFYRLIQVKDTKYSTLIKYLNKIDALIMKIKAKYNDIFTKNPDSKIANNMYGTFLLDILGDEVNGKKQLSYSEVGKNKRKTKDTILNVFSNDLISLLITSGNQDNFGRIIYASNSLCNLLDLTQDDLLNCKLSSIIPKPFNEYHDKYL